MAIQLVHEGLAETHHLIVGATADGEVGTSLATTHRQCGQCILESLFEAQELQDAQVHGRVETQATLVRTDGAVELYAVAEVYMHLALVVSPGHTESDDALGFYDALNQLGFLKLGMLVIDILDGD